MPTYDYACAACSHRFEVRQSMKDDPLTECPVCEGAIRRVIHAPSIVFKGSGFYKNDSRTAPKEEAAAAPAAGGDGAKTEATAPASTAESKPAAESGASSKTAEPAGAAKTKTPPPKAAATGSSSATT